MSDSIITAKDLIKKYNGLTAVDSISFNINKGECFGFLGPNGAGKTTTIKMIHCVSPITSGTISVNGMEANVDNRKIKAVTGVIPQENRLDTELTVYQNLMMFANYFDIPKQKAAERTEELLKFVELDKKKKSKIEELSTGMKRRLLIARALINEPKIIIADEPTTGLDPQARHLIWQRLRQLKSQGVTLVITTQYMEEAEQLCDRIVIMDKGKILKEAIPSKIIGDEIGKEVVEIRIEQIKDDWIISKLEGVRFEHERVGDTLYLYCKNGHDVMKKVIELDLPKVLNRPASLEDVFLKLTGRSLIE